MPFHGLDDSVRGGCRYLKSGSHLFYRLVVKGVDDYAFLAEYVGEYASFFNVYGMRSVLPVQALAVLEEFSGALGIDILVIGAPQGDINDLVSAAYAEHRNSSVRS